MLTPAVSHFSSSQYYFEQRQQSSLKLWTVLIDLVWHSIRVWHRYCPGILQYFLQLGQFWEPYIKKFSRLGLGLQFGVRGGGVLALFHGRSLFRLFKFLMPRFVPYLTRLRMFLAWFTTLRRVCQPLTIIPSELRYRSLLILCSCSIAFE